MKPEKLVVEVLNFITSDTQLIIDGGDIAIFTYSLISNYFRLPSSTFTSIGMGHPGVGVCSAIAVKLAKPNNQLFV